MADAKAAAQAPEERLIILPVDIDDSSVNAVSWAAKNALRNGASSTSEPWGVRWYGCGGRLAPLARPA